MSDIGDGSGRRTYLTSGRVADGGDEGVELVAHGLCGDAGGGSFEIDMTCAADAGIGVAAGHERGGHVEVGSAV